MSPAANHKTLLLFNFDWDAIAFGQLSQQWPQLHAGFDLFSFPSNTRLAWFDMQRFSALAALKARALGARAVVSNHEQFGALCAALVAEKNGWPGTPVEAILACQHKLYAREVLQRVAPEANIPFQRLEAGGDGQIPEGLSYPAFVKPVKAAFSVLARQVNSRRELVAHTRFDPWERWILRHLVAPFEKIRRERLPEAGTAHSLMLEQPRRGRQYCLDGYVFAGSYRRLGVVDSIMYPGTSAFMRFDYPGHLPEAVKQQADDIARRFLGAVGFSHGMFNMEFIHDEESGQVKVIEFNPRLAAQFSDLYQRVEGLNLHAMALALSHAIDPASVPQEAPSANCASSFVYRSFDPAKSVPMPGKTRAKAFHAAFPDGLLFEFPKLPRQVRRDFKWLGSYRYGIVHLGGENPEDLRLRCERASALLGWPAPYAQNAAESAAYDSRHPAWRMATATDKATG